MRPRGTSRGLRGPSTLGISNWLLETLNDSPFGLAIYDKRLRLVAVNAAVAAMDRVPVEDHVGRETSEIAGAVSKIIEPCVERVFRTGKSLNRFELSAQLPTRGEVAHWIEDFIPIPDPRDRVTEVGVIAMEITKQKRLEATIRELRKVIRGWSKIRDERALSALAKAGMRRRTSVPRKLPPGIIFIPAAAETPSAILSPREFQVLRLLAQGKSNKQAASHLKISEKTVETHRSRVTVKLGLSSLAELIRYAIRHGVVEP
jgi:DNA-binding CsgD family transcriptional regulator